MATTGQHGTQAGQAGMALPPNHPMRVRLNDEVHARPPEPLRAPCRLSYLALLCDADQVEASWAAVCALAETCGVTPPERGASHFSADLYAFRLRWERHTEFVRYTIVVAGSGDGPFTKTALAAVPQAWVAALPGALIVAAHLALLPDDADQSLAPVEAVFTRDVLVGSGVSGGVAAAFTDFRIYPDGFSRVLVQDRGMAPRQAGRVCQRLLEIDTYRMMALLALPVAQAVAPFIQRCDAELARITAAMRTAGETDDPALLERLTRLAAEIDSRQADTLFRFSAAAAYDGIVQNRIQELREQRIPGLQTLQEFTERRLAPAMGTCRSVATRQDELSRRVARAAQLLATRVGVTSELQNQRLLEAMNRRVRLQLRLQSAVEGLSIAAITYYVVALIGYLAKGLHEAGLPVPPDIVMAVATPAVVILMALALRRMRRRLKAEE